MELTVSMQQYLEAVYELSSGGSCRVSDIAAKLDVSKASVNSAMNVLSSKGLLENEKYREVKLTTEGQRLAEVLSRKHAILQCLLAQVIGVDPALANEDACTIEHVISADTVQKIYDFLVAQGIPLPSEL